MPPTVASARAVVASSSVAGSRSRITRSASCWSQSERPKFPRQRLMKKAPYCAHQDPVRPNSRRTRSRSCTVEPTGAMRMAGSPGRIRRIANTSRLTPQSERIARRRRLNRKRKDMTRTPGPDSPRACAKAGRTISAARYGPQGGCLPRTSRHIVRAGAHRAPAGLLGRSVRGDAPRDRRVPPLGSPLVGVEPEQARPRVRPRGFRWWDSTRCASPMRSSRRPRSTSPSCCS